MKETTKDMENSAPCWQLRGYAADGENVYRQLQPSQLPLQHGNIQSPEKSVRDLPPSSPSQPQTAYISNAAATWTQKYPRMWPDTPSYYSSATQPTVLYSFPSASLGYLAGSKGFLEENRFSVGHAYNGNSKLQRQTRFADTPWPSWPLYMSEHADGDRTGECTGDSKDCSSRGSQLLSTSPAPVLPSFSTPPWNIPLQDLHDLQNRATLDRAPAQRFHDTDQEVFVQLGGATMEFPERDEKQKQNQDRSSLGPVGGARRSVGTFEGFGAFGSFTHTSCAASTTRNFRQGLSQGGQQQQQQQQQQQAELEARSEEARDHAESELSIGADSTASAASAAAVTSNCTSISAVTPPWPSAPGFRPPLTGYEFELQHDVNLRELQRQKQWARMQLSSCNENARFHHTQTTGCIVAVNGCIIGPYSPDSLRCYGTNPEITGLRVTMTVHEGVVGGSSLASAVGTDSESTFWTGTAPASPLFDQPTLVLRHQIVVPSRRGVAAGGSGYPGYYFRRKPSSPRPLSLLSSSASSGGVLAAASKPASASTSSSSVGSVHQQSRRRHFATTVIPLRGGMAARPGYRPLEAAEAASRISSWGGNPSHGVFGNAWLMRLAIEPNHILHMVDTRAMDLLAGRGMSERGGVGGGGGWLSGGQQQLQQQDAVLANITSTLQCMDAVNQSMEALKKQDGTLSIMLSNHATQKRMARQCPDLVAMWVLAQENL